MTKEKWNKNCKCDCPKEAHVTYEKYPTFGKGSSKYADYKCQASVNFNGGSYPCRCDFITKTMLKEIICESCGMMVPLEEPVWFDWDNPEDVTDFNNEVCRGQNWLFAKQKEITDPCLVSIAKYNRSNHVNLFKKCNHQQTGKYCSECGEKL